MKGSDANKIIVLSYIKYFENALHRYCDGIEVKSKLDIAKFKAMWRTAEMERCFTEVILWSILAAESLINYYGYKKFGVSAVKDHFDKLSLVNKWVLVSSYQSDRGFSYSNELIKKFEIIVSLRNKIVHEKPLPIDKQKVKIVHKGDAEMAYLTVNSMGLRLHEIDPKIKVDWIDANKRLPRLTKVRKIWKANPDM